MSEGMKKVVGVVVFLCHFTQCLDQHWVNNIAGMNRTSYLTKEQHNRTSGSRLTINDTEANHSSVHLGICSRETLVIQDTTMMMQCSVNQGLASPFCCISTA